MIPGASRGLPCILYLSHMWRTIWIFSALALAVWILLRIGRLGYYSGTTDPEWIFGSLAVLFLLIGMGLQRHARPKPPSREADQRKIRQLGLTPRECEVLLPLCKGLSNREIADELHISESTVKTHVSNLLVKLDVRRRTQVIRKARALNLLPEGSA